MATSPDISVNSQILDELNTKEARELHDAINNLRACGVDKIVNLPQIIVVGAQSSGKSSVLEALCHIRFPVKEGVCTRFATELVLRPAAGTNVKATIRYADRAKPPLVIERSGFDENDLPEIIQQSKEHMGISASSKGFSRDVLHLEIEGPKMYPLTLVDLPGLFQSDTETQSLSGKETVDSLVLDYMSQKKSIILAVITADQELANHGALARVKSADPARERTIGVVTKTDLLRAGSSKETDYEKLVRNQEGANKLALGWHAVRNRTEAETETETDIASRDAAEEEFFKTGVWSSVPKQSLGIASLRRTLSKVLYDHIRKNLPEVIRDIEKNLQTRQTELNRLGSPRTDHHQMRSFLIKIASEYQSLARDAVQGRYDDPFFGGLESEDHKLRAQLRNFNRAFQHILWTKGASRTIQMNKGAAAEPAQDAPPLYLQEFLYKYSYDFPNPVITTESALDVELQRQAALNQGKEFPGLPNKDLAIKLFQEQAKPWEAISRFHIGRVTLVTKAFVDSVFAHIVGSPETSRTTEAILSTCVDSFFADKERILEGRLADILRPYREGYTVALDFEFHAALSQKSMEPIAERAWKILKDNVSVSKDTMLHAIMSAKSQDDGEFGTQTVVNMMLAYYETARRTFAVNIINLAIESCLVSDIPDILTPSKVSAMSDEKLEELAAENADIQDRRRHLTVDIKILGNALSLCQKYRPRGTTALPSAATGKSAGVPSPLPQVGTQKANTPSAATLPKANVGSLSDKSLPTRERKDTSSPPAKAKLSGAGLFGSNPAPKQPPSNGSLLGGGLSQSEKEISPNTGSGSCDPLAKKLGTQATGTLSSDNIKPGTTTTTAGSSTPFGSTTFGSTIIPAATTTTKTGPSLFDAGTTLPASATTAKAGPSLFGGGTIPATATTTKTGPSLFSGGTIPATATTTKAAPSLFGAPTKAATAATTGETSSNGFSIGGTAGTQHNESNSRVLPDKRVEVWDQWGTPAFSEQDPFLNRTQFQHICAIERYRNKSPEELKLDAYTSGVI